MKKFFAMMVCVMMVMSVMAMGPQEAFAATTAEIPAEGKVQTFERTAIEFLRDEIPDEFSVDKIERSVYGDTLEITFCVTSLETYETDEFVMRFNSIEEVDAKTLALRIYRAF